MSRENNFFACDSCEWSNTNYNECLCPLPWCPVSHFLFLSAVRDDLNWWEVFSVHPFGLVLWLYNGTSCMILLLFLHLDRVWLAEVGCHLTACLTSFVFPRPFDPRWIRVHLTSLRLSLFFSLAQNVLRLQLDFMPMHCQCSLICCFLMGFYRRIFGSTFIGGFVPDSSSEKTRDHPV